MSDQLHAASRQFPESYIMEKQGASYVEHSVVGQRLLEVFGFYDMLDVELIRGHVPAWVDKRDEKKNKPALDDAVTGVLLTLRVHTDKGLRTVTEVGEVEFPHNHTTDASRAKHATSDAIKRCAMRLGIGLHLWSGGHYYLDRSMDHRAGEEEQGDGMPDAPDPDSPPVEPEPASEDTEPEPEPEPDGEMTEDERMDVIVDLLKAFPDEFVSTLDTDKMFAFVVESDDNVKRAIDLIEQKFEEYDGPPAPGYVWHKGGGHYDLYDKDMRPEDSVRGKDNVPKGYVELRDEPAIAGEVVVEGNDEQAPMSEGDAEAQVSDMTFDEFLAEYPEGFRAWLVDEGVSLESMSRLASKSDKHKANALKVIGNRWLEFSGEGDE